MARRVERRFAGEVAVWSDAASSPPREEESQRETASDTP